MKKILLIFFLSLVVAFGYAQNMPNYWVPSSGTDTYTTGIPSWTGVSYNNKVGFVQFANTNTGASTINVNSFGAAALRKWSGSAWVALSAGDIKTNTTYKISYDNTNSYFMIEGGNLGGSSGSVAFADITGDPSDNAALQAELDLKANLASPTFTGTVTIPNVLPVTNLTSLTNSRTFTSADDLDQSDNLNIVYANSASPFDITVDLLTTGSQVTVINIGSATATLIEGSGVTLDGTTIPIASGETAVIIYRVPATPEVYTGTSGGGSGTVTSVGFTGGLISVATPTTTPALTVAGTSGGIPYFSSSSTWASSAALAANALVIGGGAGVAPATTTTASGVLTFLGTPSSANLRSALTDELGTGAALFDGATPTSLVGTNITGTAAGLTAGAATVLATTRAIYGNNFDGSAALTQIIASTYGGTGNGFTKFSGPATSEKTFTLPNASATILTDNAAVTGVQGGTGQTTTTTGDILIGAGSNTWSKLAIGTNTYVLKSNGTTASWQPNTSVSYGYLTLNCTQYTPIDAETHYWGMLTVNPTTTPAVRKIYVRNTMTIVGAEIYSISGTAGSNEAWSIYIRVNNTTDYLVATVSASTQERVWSNTGLSISLSAGDYFEMKSVCPTWATNPNPSSYTGYVRISE